MRSRMTARGLLPATVMVFFRRCSVTPHSISAPAAWLSVAAENSARLAEEVLDVLGSHQEVLQLQGGFVPGVVGHA